MENNGSTFVDNEVQFEITSTQVAFLKNPKYTGRMGNELSQTVVHLKACLEGPRTRRNYISEDY